MPIKFKDQPIRESGKNSHKNPPSSSMKFKQTADLPTKRSTGLIVAIVIVSVLTVIGTIGGFVLGRTSGYSAGFNDGYGSGYAVGAEEDFTTSWHNGYDAGVTMGYECGSGMLLQGLMIPGSVNGYICR